MVLDAGEASGRRRQALARPSRSLFHLGCVSILCSSFWVVFAVYVATLVLLDVAAPSDPLLVTAPRRRPRGRTISAQPVRKLEFTGSVNPFTYDVLPSSTRPKLLLSQLFLSLERVISGREAMATLTSHRRDSPDLPSSHFWEGFNFSNSSSRELMSSNKPSLGFVLVRATPFPDLCTALLKKNSTASVCGLEPTGGSSTTVECKELSVKGFASPPIQQVTTATHIVVMLFTLPPEMVPTISVESFVSSPRLLLDLIQPLCRIAETLQGFDHLLGFGLFAESSVVKFSFKATIPPKICLRFNIVLVNCRNSRPYSLYIPFLAVETIVQECGRARSSRYYVTVASPSQYAVSSIDGSSQSRPYNPPSFSLSLELLCKSVDSPVLIATISPLRLHYITPSQALTVLHRVGTVTLSPELQSSTEVLGFLVIKTRWLGSSTSISTYLRSFERGL
ncbi:hypothetical protein DY000_02005043 [Brassica cretica]|uniref:Uncharacterized protein n=1 Tax=Brassica cretica TaxID=69181 RepID=A0ABQ7BSN4_BRACR|nr:hypothetical protein DY000_02005043 [Brassica cretica]